MKSLWNKRRLVGVGALGALIGLTLWLVLPALASNPGDFVLPASGDGVAPYDVAVGGTGDCGTLFTGGNSLGAVSEYDNVNPKTKSGLSSGNRDGVTFDLSLNTDQNKNQTLDVRGHGAAILGIGIKGGTQSTAYDYALYAKAGTNSDTFAGSVAADTGLHSPLQSFTTTATTGGTSESGSQFYTVSQLTVCYTVLSSVAGTVYQDTNQNGANDDGSPQANWTVDLYSGVTPGAAGGGTLIASQQTDSAGGYRFPVPANGTHYRVCEVPNGGDTPSNGGSVWVQTQPLPSTAALCNGTGELPKGYDFTPTSSAGATDDFGNVGGYSCNGAPVGINDYTVGECKANQLYVFSAGKENGDPFVAYWVGDPTQAQIPVVEQINFDDPFVAGSPKFTKLLYADGGGFPPSFDNLVQMPYCQVDPRDPTGSDGFALQGQYASVDGSSSVLPSGQTSCVISIKTTAPTTAGGDGTLQAYVYALGDSVRVGN